MDAIWNEIVAFFTVERVMSLVKVVVILVVGWTLARLVASAAYRLALVRGGEAGALLIRRLVRYGLLVVVVMMVLSELGFDVGILLGAAGVLSVAIGFASQTSASNVISGLFLMAERPFSVGDFIKVGPDMGTVSSIDLLSVKLRTLDNLFVRVPNTSVLNGTLTNFSRYPTRRVDLSIGVAYHEDLGRVRDVLLELAATHPLVFDEPPPVVTFIGFAESSMNLELRLWTRRQHVLELRSTTPEAIKRAFDEHGVEIPFPQRVLHVRTSAGDTALPAEEALSSALSGGATPSSADTPTPEGSR